jgi:hypothetical protein
MLLRPLAAWGRLWLSPSLRKHASRSRQKAAKAGTVRLEVK